MWVTSTDAYQKFKYDFPSNTSKMPLWTICSKRKELGEKNGIVQCFCIVSGLIRGRHVVDLE